mmetsp:Transcript_138714/g.312276  ORF Transcript_138714/g.312276 Transcript_138714/m.312276 type:complete len:410 (-) Transcript_138714:116-1345(-)
MTGFFLNQPGRAILFGDSITQFGFAHGGWGAQVADHFQRRLDVLNRGFSGYTTRWALRSVEQVFPEKANWDDVAFVTLFFGANDASLPLVGARQHVPMDEYKENLVQLCAYFKRVIPKAKLVLITPPPVDPVGRMQWSKQRFGPAFAGPLQHDHETAGRYAARCREVASEVGAECVDLWTILQSHADWASLLSDGLHLSESGNGVVGKAVVAKLQTVATLEIKPCSATGSLCNSSTRSALAQCLPWHDKIADIDGRGPFTAVVEKPPPKPTPAAVLATPNMSVEALLKDLEDPLWYVRSAAAASLGKRAPGGAEALPRLVQALQDPHEDVRCAAADAIGMFTELATRATPDLVTTLRDPEHVVRRAAAEALGRLGLCAVAAVDPLIETLQDPDTTVRGAAADALKKMGR